MERGAADRRSRRSRGSGAETPRPPALGKETTDVWDHAAADGCDSHGTLTVRPPATLRLGVTDRCDLRCAYCMPPEGVELAPRSALLSLERLAAVVDWLHRSYPLARIKLTGGEPLVRRGLVDLVRDLATLPGSPELSLTSNGTRLAAHAAELAAVGLARVNISLDTLDPERFRQLTRGGSLADVLAGIAAARAAGLAPIKLNAVLHRSSWRDDVPALLDFAAAQRLRLRFLELMRTGTERAWCAAEAIPANEVLMWLERHRDCELTQGHILAAGGPEPARTGRLRWRGAELEVGWILPVSRPFCADCDRFRLDPRGRLRRCLMDPVTLPLATILATAGDAAAAAAVADHLAGKRPPLTMDTMLPMVQLGG